VHSGAAMVDTRSVHIQCPTEEWKPVPTDWYRLRYFAIWSVPLAAFGGSIALIILSIAAFMVHDSDQHERGNHPERGTWMLLLGLFLLVLVIWMRGSSTQLRYRAGMGLFSGLGGASTDQAPTSLFMTKIYVQEFRNQGVVPTIVGGAWSNVLGLRTTYGPRIHMRRMVGRVPDERLAWYAGTELMDINKELKEKGFQLVNVPSYGCVTIGAWVATQGHGMTGRAFSHSPITVKAKVLDLKTGIETMDEPAMLLDKFGQGAQRASQFLILWVSLEGSPTLVPNNKMLRQGRWLRTQGDAAWVMRKEAQVAVVFIGSTHSLALTWEPYIGEDVKGGGALMDAGILMFAVVGWGLSDPSGRGRDRTELLDKAPGFFHFYLSPIFIWLFMILRTLNVEIYTADLSLTPEVLLKLTTEIQDVFKKYNGRCEIRFLGKLTYFDFLVLSEEAVLAVCRILSMNGVQTVTQHSGKYCMRPEFFQCVGLELKNVYDVVR